MDRDVHTARVAHVDPTVSIDGEVAAHGPGVLVHVPHIWTSDVVVWTGLGRGSSMLLPVPVGPVQVELQLADV